MANRPRKQLQRRRHYIKEWRIKRGLSQEQLAERIERSRGLISQLESNTTNYTAQTLEAIAFALGVDSWQLLNVNPAKEGQVVDILDLLRGATPEEQARALAVVQALVGRN